MFQLLIVANEVSTHVGSNWKKSGYTDGMYFYRPQRSWAKVMFLQASVILSTASGGVCLSACWDTPPQGAGPLPPGADTPPEQTPPRSRPPSPGSRHPPRSRLQHTVNERPVRILLECILVFSAIKGLIVIINQPRDVSHYVKDGLLKENKMIVLTGSKPCLVFDGYFMKLISKTLSFYIALSCHSRKMCKLDLYPSNRTT